MALKYKNKVVAFLLLVILLMISRLMLVKDPLPSWNDGPIKEDIIQFVKKVTNKNSENYVPPAERIATLDNDGTLWVEYPLYTQFLFFISRYKQLAETHPEWQQTSLYKTLGSQNMLLLSKNDWVSLITLTSGGISVQEYLQLVKTWLASAVDQRFKKHYTQLIYQPMLELITYLTANNFKVYIVSGGDQDFMRAFSPTVYQIPAERVIGSTSKSQYDYRNGHPELIKMPRLLFISNESGKPEAINLFIGKKPILAFGNSDGDRQMLEWTQSNTNPHLMLLVHHDDAEREYAYGDHSLIGTFSAALMTEAKKKDWKVVSMKKDWKRIFPFEKT